MNFNISKNVPSAIFVQSAPARARNSAIATAILLLLVFAGFVQAAGDAEWAAGARQVNDALRQMRQQAQGVPGAMQYVNLAEKLWKQAQDQWAMQQRYQQQIGVNQIRTQLLAQQQNLMNQLIKQQQFLQQQLAAWKTPELKTIDPFGDYRAHGVSLHPKDGRLHGPGTIADTPELSGLFRQPDMNAKEGPGMEAWKEAIRQLDSISSASSSFPTPPAASPQTPNKGAYDNPLADNASSVDTASVFGSEGTVGLLREQKKTISEKEFEELRQDMPRIDELNNKTALSAEESAELRELTTKRNTAWEKVVSNTDLTQEERERLQLKMQVKPAVLDDHPMVDSRAFVEKERYSDPVLDVAMAAAKAGATVVAVSLIGKGGKEYLKADQGTAEGFDTVLHLGKAGVVERPKSDAETFVAVGNYALTYLPKELSTTKLVVDAGVNAVGAATRQAFVRYWASRDEYDLTPVKNAQDKWNSWYADQNQWARAVLKRVGAGEYK